jgi:hypothetical protein
MPPVMQRTESSTVPDGRQHFYHRVLSKLVLGIGLGVSPLDTALDIIVTVSM